MFSTIGGKTGILERILEIVSTATTGKVGESQFSDLILCPGTDGCGRTPFFSEGPPHVANP
jgi:hypothetical protein